MTQRVFIIALAAAVTAGPQPIESRVRIGQASLYVRTIGDGRPAIVLHGGPDFDHRYLLPDLDRLADVFRLVYYDQRVRNLKMPALVIAGDRDFIPVEISAHIARALPNGRLVTLGDCGHFAYMECAPDVRRALVEFAGGAPAGRDAVRRRR